MESIYENFTIFKERKYNVLDNKNLSKSLGGI